MIKRLLMCFLFLVFNFGAYAEESNVFPPKSVPSGVGIPEASAPEGSGAASGTSSSQTTDSKDPPPSKKKSQVRKAKRGEVKETEGSTAPERFEGNTILKSQYTLDGQSLEIDPD